MTGIIARFQGQYESNEILDLYIFIMYNYLSYLYDTFNSFPFILRLILTLNFLLRPGQVLLTFKMVVRLF